MDIFIGVLLGLFGAGLVAGNRVLGEATTRSNVAATKGHFAGPGWVNWNRFIYCLVGACFIAAGLALALDLVQLERG